MPYTWHGLAEWMLSQLAPKASRPERPEPQAWGEGCVRYHRDNEGEEASGYAGAIQGYNHLPRPSEARAEVSTGGADSSGSNMPAGQHPNSQGDSAGHPNHREERNNYMVVASPMWRISPRIIFSSKKITR